MMKNNLNRVMQYAARCCREDEMGRVKCSEVEKQFPEIAEWVFDYFQWDEAKEFFSFDGRTIELKQYYKDIPAWELTDIIREKCNNN